MTALEARVAELEQAVADLQEMHVAEMAAFRARQASAGALAPVLVARERRYPEGRHEENTALPKFEAEAKERQREHGGTAPGKDAPPSRTATIFRS